MKKISTLVLAFCFVSFLSGCQNQKQDIYSNTVIPVVETTPTIPLTEVDPTIESSTTLTPVITETEVPTIDTEINPPLTTEKKSDAVAVDEPENIISNYSFDKCDTRWQFKTEAWYPEFVDAITNTPALTSLEAARMIAIEGSEYSSAQDAIADYGNLSETNIAHICRTSGDEMALVMINGSTDITGGMARYDITNNQLEFATIDPYSPMHLYSFTARAGDVIPLRAGYREEECLSTFKVDYNFVTNRAVPVRQCKTCGSEAEICTSLIE